MVPAETGIAEQALCRYLGVLDERLPPHLNECVFK